MNLKILTLTYLLSFAGIVVLANSGSELSFIIFSKIKVIPFYDKILHVLLLGGMTYLFNSAFNFPKIQIGNFAFLLWTLLIGIGITIEEFSQIFNPYRNFEIPDLICNYAGILMGNMVFNHTTSIKSRFNFE